MYEFFYDYLKARYGPRCDLIYTDTDSLLLHIQTDDVYEDMKEHKHLYDTYIHTLAYGHRLIRPAGAEY